MRSLPEGWRLTAHAKEQMAERAILPSELVALLAQPEQMTPGRADNPGTECWWRGTIGAVVNPETREVVTILLNGATRKTWTAVARERASGPADDAEALLGRLATPVANGQERRSQGRTRAPKAHKAPVFSRNVFDDAVDNNDFRDLALEAAGGDARKIRIVRPGVIEIVE